MTTVKYSSNEIDIIAERLLKGGIIAFPTDTVFGLGCISTDPDAIRKIYEAKGRSFDKPLPMMCNSIEMTKQYTMMSAEAEKIMETFTPGALTLIFRKRNLEDFVTNGKDSIAVRIPNDPWILELINKVNKPLSVTSANLSDKGSLLKWVDVYQDLNGKIDGIVTKDATGSIASTIIDVTGEVKVLREGPISLEDIRKIL